MVVSRKCEYERKKEEARNGIAAPGLRASGAHQGGWLIGEASQST
jgi:hypothetical protein